MIGIINYGLGNINAIYTVYKNLNISAEIISEAKEFEKCDKFILPGVGAFDYAMEKLNKSGFKDVLNDKIINQKKDILGICVGMQMLAYSSDEGTLPGLSWINAEIKKIDWNLEHSLTIPHMGWNNIKKVKDISLLDGLDNHSNFYFLHSYYFKINDNNQIISTTEYGKNFASIINQKNIYGVQFHPEKSHQSGIQLLENFSKI